jgi:hypothetical protein
VYPSFTLSLAAVDTLWELLRVGARPFPFEIPYHGATMEERGRIRNTVLADLESRGLASRGKLEPEVVDCLSALASSEIALTAAALLDVNSELQLTARAAANGRFAVLGVLQGQQLRVGEVPRDGMVRAIVGVIPNERPGPGQQVTVSSAAQRPASDDEGGIMRSTRTTPAANQPRAVELIMRRPRLRVGHFTVEAKDRRRRRLASPVLGWFDTDEGRYLNESQRGRDGADWVTYAPADNARLARRLGELMTSVQG